LSRSLAPAESVSLDCGRAIARVILAGVVGIIQQ